MAPVRVERIGLPSHGPKPWVLPLDDTRVIYLGCQSGRRVSNPLSQFEGLPCCRYTTPREGRNGSDAADTARRSGLFRRSWVKAKHGRTVARWR